MKRITVYTKAGCPFCSLLKMELDKRGFSYESFDLSDDVVRAKFYVASGTKTVPQIYIHTEEASLALPLGVNMGGYSDIAKDWSMLTKAVS